MLPDGTVLCNPGFGWGWAPLAGLSGLALNSSPGQGFFVWLWVPLLCCSLAHGVLVFTATIAPYSGPKCSRPQLDQICAVSVGPCPPHSPSYFSSSPRVGPASVLCLHQVVLKACPALASQLLSRPDPASHSQLLCPVPLDSTCHPLPRPWFDFR